MSLEIAVFALVLSVLNLGYLAKHHGELHVLRKNIVALAKHTKYVK